MTALRCGPVDTVCVRWKQGCCSGPVPRVSHHLSDLGACRMDDCYSDLSARVTASSSTLCVTCARHELLDPENQRRAEGKRVWLAEQVELLASSICPPWSLAVASHAFVSMFTTLCFLLPKKERTSNPLWVLVFFAAAATVSTLDAATVRRLAAAATAQFAPLSPSGRPMSG